MNLPLSQTAATTAMPVSQPAPFRFSGPEGSMTARTGLRLPPGPASDRSQRAAAALNGSPTAVVGGALPFDRDAEDCLWHADPAADASPEPVTDPMPPACEWHVRAEPEPSRYAQMVRHALGLMTPARGDGLQKIVLARSLLLQAPRPIPVPTLMARLQADPAITAFCVALPGGRRLCGATPELLLAKRGGAIRSHPLAGSARRLPDPAADRDAARRLEASEKDHREHALVVEAILDTLAPHCRQLACPQGTTVTATRSMWHLGTAIHGRLRDPDMPSIALATALHPTPAVCGVPAQKAAEEISRIEPVPRDFYAGAVGWCDARGDGIWHVAIRCAQIDGAQARLYAGAGIVAGSDPSAETAETAAKFGALLSALGLPPDAASTLECDADRSFAGGA